MERKEKKEKGKAEAEDKNLVQRIFYLNHPVWIRTKTGFENITKRKATVVLLIDTATGDYSRGIAVCNDSDNFCKKTGRTLALSRAKKAMGQGKSCPNNTIRADKFDCLFPDYVDSKCEFIPILMPFEEKALGAAFGAALKTNLEL